MIENVYFEHGDISFWLIVIIFSVWGGFVRYLMDNASKNAKIPMMAVFKQIVISGFTGLIGGLYSYENKQSVYIVLITVGVSSTLGSTLLRWLWSRFVNTSDLNK